MPAAKQSLEDAFGWPMRAVEAVLRIAEDVPLMNTSLLCDRTHRVIPTTSWCSGLGTEEWALAMIEGAMAKRGHVQIHSSEACEYELVTTCVFKMAAMFCRSVWGYHVAACLGLFQKKSFSALGKCVFCALVFDSASQHCLHQASRNTSCTPTAVT